MSKGELIPRELAEQQGILFLLYMKPYLKNRLICGSIRRKEPMVGDIDIVLVPKYNEGDQLLRAISDFSDKGLTSGTGNRNVLFTKEGMPFNVMIVKEEDFESATLHFTGSKAFNIKCRVMAKTRTGWKLNEYGLWKGNKRIAKTELGILECIHMEQFIDPITRSFK